MKTEATGNTTATLDADAAEKLVHSNAANANEAEAEAESASAASSDADTVETESDEPVDDVLSGKDRGRRKSALGTTVAKPNDLLGADGGTVTQVAEPDTAAAGQSVQVDAGEYLGLSKQQMTDARDVKRVVDYGNGVKALAGGADLAHAVAKDRKLLQATYRLGGFGDAGKMVDFHRKMPTTGPVKYATGGLALYNTYENGKIIGHDLAHGGLSEDSVVPALDIASDIAGETKHPVALAWSAGWSIGRTVDHYTGASDKASDLMAYGTTKPWAGTVQEGRANMKRYEQRMQRRQNAKKQAARGPVPKSPKAGREAPRLDADNTRVDSSGRVYVNDEYRGRYENGRFIAADAK